MVSEVIEGECINSKASKASALLIEVLPLKVIEVGLSKIMLLFSMWLEAQAVIKSKLIAQKK